MNYKILLYYNNGKSQLRIISRNAALPVPLNENLFKTGDQSYEFSVRYDNIDDVLENLDAIISEAVESMTVDGSTYGVPSYQILTADSVHAVAESHEKSGNPGHAELNSNVNDILASIYKIVGS